ncbi:MAG: four helix bundle protein [Candidatus Omnitrophica bacterium]|nr:four helix bundle protein [Candidatus Omnitrophota bacterium]
MIETVEQENLQKGFRGLKAWQESYQLALEVYKATEAFPMQERFSLTLQIRKAALSVSSNIAEGYERRSRKEFAKGLMRSVCA